MNLLEQNLDVFIKILKLVPNRDYPIILSGSTSLALQQVDIEVHDIDIVTDKSGAIALGNLLREYQIKEMEYSETDRYKSFLGKYNIDGVDIDIMGDFQYKLQSGEWSDKNHIHEIYYVEYKSERIPVLSLDQELVEYESAGKTATIAKIKEKIKKLD